MGSKIQPQLLSGEIGATGPCNREKYHIICLFHSREVEFFFYAVFLTFVEVNFNFHETKFTFMEVKV